MSVVSEEFWGAVQVRGAPGVSTHRVRETHWGFTVKKGSKGQDAESLAETGLKTIGLTMLPAGLLLLLHPVIATAPGGALAYIGLPIGFTLIGLAIYTLASRGFRTEIQADSHRGIIRIGTANNQGVFRLRRVIVGKSVESIFLKRSETKRGDAKMHLRLKGKQQTIQILHGSERSLVPVLERMTEHLRQPNAAGRRARTRTTGQFIRVSFS